MPMEIPHLVFLFRCYSGPNQGSGAAALNCENRGRLAMIATGRIPGLKVDRSRETLSWCGLHYELNPARLFRYDTKRYPHDLFIALS
jgi:hypothetical protein